MTPNEHQNHIALEELLRTVIEYAHPGINCPCPLCLIMHPGNDFD